MKHLSTALVVLAATARAALVSVSNFGDNPTSLQMSIYVPDKLATKPAVILAVSIHLGSSLTI